MDYQKDLQQIRNQCHCSGAQERKLTGQRSAIRLSWPRESDKRRAIVSSTPSRSGTSLSEIAPRASSSGDVNDSDARFIHVSYWDIELHNRLTRLGPTYDRSFLHIPWTPWNPSKLRDLDRGLLEYCRLALCCVLHTLVDGAS